MMKMMMIMIMMMIMMMMMMIRTKTSKAAAAAAAAVETTKTTIAKTKITHYRRGSSSNSFRRPSTISTFLVGLYVNVRSNKTK
jgi:hypothetical protein